jgi:hypothetical protein
MEFYDHDVARMIVSPGNIYMRRQHIDQVCEFGNGRRHKIAESRLRAARSVCLLACDIDMIHQNGIAIRPENEMFHEMQEFVKFSESNTLTIIIRQPSFSF